MSWAEIKKALNGRLGEKGFESIDVIAEKVGYEAYYNTMLSLYSHTENADITVVPNGTREITRSLFTGNEKNIVLPPSARITEDSTLPAVSLFYNFTNLKQIIFPEGVLLSAPFLFQSCSSLESVVFPRSLRKIRGGLFFNCPNLKIVQFKSPKLDESSSVTWFVSCENLTDVYVAWSEGDVEGAPWGAENATIHYNAV